MSHFGKKKKENEAGLGSDMSVSCFKEGKTYIISGTDFEISEHPVYRKTLFFLKLIF